jgi:hypothetical protein
VPAFGNFLALGRYAGAEEPLKSSRYRKKVDGWGYIIDFPQY